jgi:hypothetical protein
VTERPVPSVPSAATSPQCCWPRAIRCAPWSGGRTSAPAPCASWAAGRRGRAGRPDDAVDAAVSRLPLELL